LVVAALLVAGGAMIGALAARALGRRRVSMAADDERARAALSSREQTPGLAVGDVVSVRGEHAWLEGGWMLYEGSRRVGAVLFAPELVLVEAAGPRPAWYKAWPAALGIATTLPEPPASLEHDGERFERRRRIPVRIEPLGEAPAPPGEAALFAEYYGLSGDCLWMVRSALATAAFRGARLRDEELERWGSSREPPHLNPTPG
jgi:hypothetical protein